MATFMLAAIYRITGLGIVAVGQVTRDVLKPGMKTNIDGRLMEIKSMEMRHKQLSAAKMGDNVGILLKNGDYDVLKRRANTEIEFM